MHKLNTILITKRTVLRSSSRMRDTCPPQSKDISMLSSFPSGLTISLVTVCINSGVRL